MSSPSEDFECDEDGLPIIKYPFRDMLSGLVRSYAEFHFPNDPEFSPEEYVRRHHVMLFDLSEAIGEVLFTLGISTDEDLAAYLKASVCSALNQAKKQVEHGNIAEVSDYVMNHLNDLKH